MLHCVTNAFVYSGPLMPAEMSQEHVGEELFCAQWFYAAATLRVRSCAELLQSKLIENDRFRMK